MALCGHSPARSADFRDTLHSWEAQPLGCSQLESTELKLGGGGEGRGGPAGAWCGPLTTVRILRAPMRARLQLLRTEPAWGAKMRAWALHGESRGGYGPRSLQERW